MIDTEILEDYSSEARELLEEMDHSLMRLEKEGGVQELLNNVFRAVHCIKGSAQYIGLESSSTLTHGVENLLDRLREGVLELDGTIMEFLFKAKDLMAALIEEVSKYREERSDIAGIMEQLDLILQGKAPFKPLSSSKPEPGVTAMPPAVAEPELEADPELEAEAPDEAVSDTEDLDETAVIEAYPMESTEELDTFAADMAAASLVEDDVLDDEDESLYSSLPYVVRPYEEEQPEEDASVAEETSAQADDEESAAEAEQQPVTALAQAPPAREDEELDSAAILEGTVPHILTISLYLDDLQDGFFQPSELIPSLLDTVETVRESLVRIEMPEAVELLEGLKSRLLAVDVESEAFSLDDIELARSILYALRPYYPEELFPLAERPYDTSDGAMQAFEHPPAPVHEETAAPASSGEYQPEDEEPVDQPVAAAQADASEHLPPVAAQEPISEAAASMAATTELQETQPEPEAPAPQPGPEPAGEARERSLLADVDDELLKEFESIFAASPSIVAPLQPAAQTPPDVSSPELGDGLDVVGEDADREIIEIFMAYGLEILEKLSPLVNKVSKGQPTQADIESCAELIKSIRSSSTYMDYQRLASFLDEWYEDTLTAAERTDALSAKDMAFMEKNLTRFQAFLGDLRNALNPQAAPPAAAPPAPAVVPVEPAPVQAAPVSVPAAPRTVRQAAERPLQPPAGVAPVVGAQAIDHAARSEEKPAVSSMPVPAVPLERVTLPPVNATIDATPVVNSSLPASEDDTSGEPAAVRDMYGAADGKEGAVVKTMRVDSTKVDTLLNQVGELVVNRSYVEQLSLDLKSFHRSLAGVKEVTKREVQMLKDLALKIGEASIALGRVATDIQEGVMKLRMLPVGQLFNRMPRLIRDLSRRVGKTVNLEVHGADTEVDKRVIEQIYNPLVHLIRNAVDHGIEDPETRKKMGKPEEGLIVLNAYSQGNQVSIDVEDDGGGINTTAVLEKAVENRLIEAQDATGLSKQDIYGFLFYPGFSTSKTVTRTSGRGVGMDVVKKDVEKINGHVDVESWDDQGTRISIKIPLTLAIIQTLLIRSARHVFAIPLTSVREIVQVSVHEITTIEGFEVIKFRDETIPVLRINEIFHLHPVDATRHPRFLVLAMAGSRTVGFLVEELIGEQDVVIKPLAEHVFKNRGLAGSTILGDGTIALVLDVTELIEDIISQQRQLVLSQGTKFVPAAIVGPQFETGDSLKM